MSLSCTYPTSIWRPIADDPVGISLRSLKSEHWSPWAIIRHCLRHPGFSCFGTILACDRQTDGRTHNDSIHRAGI